METTHRVLMIHTSPGIPLYGNHGGARHLREVIRAMDALGHQVTVVTRRSVRREGDAVLSLPAEVVEQPRGTLPGVLQRVPRVDETAYDLRLRVVLRALVQRLDPTLVYERFSLFSAAGMQVAHQHHLPGVLEVNAPLAIERASQEGLESGPWTEKRERSVLRTATRVVAVSPGVAEYVYSRGVPAHRVRVIPNGVDPEHFVPMAPPEAPEAWPQLQRPFVVGFCGSLKAWHDLDTLLDALAAEPGLRQAALLIIGDGPRRAELQGRAAHLGLEQRVAWVGEQPEALVPRWMALCDAMCVPGTPVPGDYFSPLKLLEAMAMGLPVVASDLAGVRMVAGADDSSVLLVPPGDAAALGQALARLAADEGLRGRLGAANRASAQAHTWQDVVRESLEGLPTPRSR